jgi:glycerophosphoryl diester phosphodiesterase
MYAVDFTLQELKTLKLKQRFPFRDQQYNGMWMCPLASSLLWIMLYFKDQFMAL